MTQKKRNTSPDDDERAFLVIPRDDAEARIQEQINKGRELLDLKIKTETDLEIARNDYYTWNDYNEELLKRIVNTDELVNSYKRTVGIGFFGVVPLQEKINEFKDDVRYYIRKLESVIARLELIPESKESESDETEILPLDVKVRSRVFIVHGHDEEAKHSVARCIEKLGLEPIILHEQPNQGRTIIEKFEDYAKVSFAIVILTPDDLGASKNDTENLSARARQNVILELGFFIGKLGRNNVCALHKGNLELPSDFSGVLWLSMDEGGAWRFNLGKEMRAAGLEIDLNKLV